MRPASQGWLCEARSRGLRHAIDWGTPEAIKLGVDKRQIDENTVLNLAADHPEWLTGVNPATGEPEPYGSVGVDINCAVLGFTAKAPTEGLEEVVPNSQFPPR